MFTAAEIRKKLLTQRRDLFRQVAQTEEELLWLETDVESEAQERGQGEKMVQLAQGGWVLSDIAKHDSKGRPVALKVFEKPFGLRAMGAALADKDFDVRLLSGRLDCGAP